MLLSSRLNRLALALLVLCGALAWSGRPGPANAQQRATSLTGQLLVATPSMGDPRFFHAVILVVHHDQDGALGIIINRPLDERTVASLLAATGDKDAAVSGSVRVFAGGPVQPEVGFVIHSTDYKRPETIAVDERVGVTSSPQILLDIGQQKGPQKTLVAFGYAGWSAGQLENEISQNAWYQAPEDPALLFDVDRDKVWETAVGKRTQDL